MNYKDLTPEQKRDYGFVKLTKAEIRFLAQRPDRPVTMARRSAKAPVADIRKKDNFVADQFSPVIDIF